MMCPGEILAMNMSGILCLPGGLSQRNTQWSGKAGVGETNEDAQPEQLFWVILAIGF